MPHCVKSNRPQSVLFRVKLNHQLLLRGDWNVRSGRSLQHLPTERVAINRDPRQRRATRRLVHRRHDAGLLARLHADTNFLTRLHQVARNVDRLLIYFDMAVPNELTRSLAAARESHAIDDVVETRLQRREKIVSGDSRKRCDALEGVPELSFAHAVDTLDL